MKKDFAEKLENVVVKILSSELSRFELPNNFLKVVCDIYPSDYGLNCNITFVMKKPFSQKESDVFNNAMAYALKNRIDKTLGGIFKNNISSQQSTIDSYQKQKWWYEEKKENFE
jgi:hypothetical protein